MRITFLSVILCAMALVRPGVAAPLPADKTVSTKGAVGIGLAGSFVGSSAMFATGGYAMYVIRKTDKTKHEAETVALEAAHQDKLGMLRDKLQTLGVSVDQEGLEGLLGEAAKEVHV